MATRKSSSGPIRCPQIILALGAEQVTTSISGLVHAHCERSRLATSPIRIIITWVWIRCCRILLSASGTSLEIGKDILLGCVSDRHIEALNDVDHDLGFFARVQRDWLSFLHDWPQLSPSDEHLVKERN